MECYFCSNPRRLGYRKRMLELWNSKGLFLITEQRLVHQAKYPQKGLVNWNRTKEIERKIEPDNGNRNDTDLGNVTPEETNTTTMSEEEPSIEQVDETPNEN